MKAHNIHKIRSRKYFNAAWLTQLAIERERYARERRERRKAARA